MNIIRSSNPIRPFLIKNNFFNDDEIEKLLIYCEKIEPCIGLVGSDPSKNTGKIELNKLNSHIKNTETGNVPRFRRSDLKWIDCNTETKWIFDKIIEEVRKCNYENFDYLLTHMENLQFTEYKEYNRGFYKKHNDCGLRDELSNLIDIRKLSLSIQLSDQEDYEGGDLILYFDGNFDKRVIVPKEKGTICLFSSDIWHEVTPVVKGSRKALVSWVRGPNIR